MLIEEEKINKILFESEKYLNNSSIKILKERLKNIEKRIENLQEIALKIGNIIDYNEMKRKGKSATELSQVKREDQKMAQEARLFLKQQKKKDRKYMFGYPSNMVSESSMIKYLRWIESQLFYTNSCGTAYECGNYQMCKKEYELKIISYIAKNLGLSLEKYWGYITSGGTEGNFWGIREGKNKFPHGILYFSDSTHYSVYKYVEMVKQINYKIISTKNDAINKRELLKLILENPKSKLDGVILVLNFGTSVMGSVDDIKYIIKVLKNNKIPFYIHIDAALYGGISNNQNKSPAKNLQQIMKLNIDSISISLHKYIGLPKTNGILLAKKNSNGKYIDYIGQFDRTISGSRDFLPFTTQQKIIEMYNRSYSDEYYENIIYFEKKLKANNIGYKKGYVKGNIFVINKPSNDICKKYQLSTFEKGNKTYAHIIIFPFHEKKIINKLVTDLCKEYN